jgi:hypothetical protein
VALLVGSEALASGLESVLLKALDDASVVQVDLRSLQDVIDAGSIELVIVSIDQWPRIAEYSNIGA